MLKWLIIVSAIVVIAIGGFWFFHRGGNDEPQYQTAAVGRGDLTQAVTATGTLNPVVNVTVGSQVSGRISKLNVDFNSVVKSNEIIAELDPSTYQATVEQATADLANARANLELQQVQFQRSSELFTNKLISGSDYDTAVATLHEGEAMVKIKQASLNNALVNLSYCKILSPVDGMVISRAVDVGQTVAASLSAPTIFIIANDLTKMQIDASVAEADVGGIEEGQDVNFTVDAYPYRTFRGMVAQVRNSPSTVQNVVTYDCVISVTNADYKLKPGMTANVSVVVAQHDDVIKIPNSALRVRLPDAAVASTQTNAPSAQIAPTNNSNRPGGAGNRQGRRRGAGGGGNRAGGERQIIHTVYILPANADKDAKPQPVQIKTGITDGISTEVTDGLNEGDQIITGANTTQASSQAVNNPFGGGGGGGGFRR